MPSTVVVVDSHQTLTIEIEALTVLAVGDVDAHTAPQLWPALDAMPTDGAVAVDLSGVNFIDSSGLRVLVRAHRRQGEGGGSLTLLAASPAVARLLDITGLAGELRLG